MKRLLSALLVLAVLTMLWANTAAADYIEDLTLDDLTGPKVPRVYRDGLITGGFLALMSSKAITCRTMSADMLKAGLDVALAAKEISGAWTVYHASLYVLMRSGCTSATDAVKEAPHA